MVVRAPIDGGIASLEAFARALREASTRPVTRAIVVDASAGSFGDARTGSLDGALTTAAGSRSRITLAVGAACTAAGLAFALRCDGLYAAPSATFAAGSPLDAESIRLLRARASEELADRLAAGETISAIEAYTGDLIDGILVNDLAEEAMMLARREAVLPRGRYPITGG